MEDIRRTESCSTIFITEHIPRTFCIPLIPESTRTDPATIPSTSLPTTTVTTTSTLPQPKLTTTISPFTTQSSEHASAPKQPIPTPQSSLPHPPSQSIQTAATPLTSGNDETGLLSTSFTLSDSSPPADSLTSHISTSVHSSSGSLLHTAVAGPTAASVKHSHLRHIGSVVGIVAAVVLILSIIAAGALCFRRRRRRLVEVATEKIDGIWSTSLSGPIAASTPISHQTIPGAPVANAYTTSSTDTSELSRIPDPDLRPSTVRRPRPRELCDSCDSVGQEEPVVYELDGGLCLEGGPPSCDNPHGPSHSPRQVPLILPPPYRRY